MAYSYLIKEFLKAVTLLINISASEYNSSLFSFFIYSTLSANFRIFTVSRTDLIEMVKKLQKSLFVPPEPSAILLDIETAARFS